MLLASTSSDSGPEMLAPSTITCGNTHDHCKIGYSHVAGSNPLREEASTPNTTCTSPSQNVLVLVHVYTVALYKTVNPSLMEPSPLKRKVLASFG